MFAVASFLKNSTFTQYDQLLDVFAVDYPNESRGRFQLTYSFLSTAKKRRIFLRVIVSEESNVDSLVSLYPSSNWLERETWDMFGIFFKNHPDLRRILTDYGFEGFPLRKDFPLSGFTEVRYDDEKKRVVLEPIQITQEYRYFDFLSPLGNEVMEMQSIREIKNFTMNFGPQHPALMGCCDWCLNLMVK